MLIAQLSDPHVRPPGLPYQGVVPSNALFEAALDDLASRDTRPDLLLLTGDLVDDDGPVAFAEVRRLAGRCGLPVLAIPGNHDDREAFRAAFGADGYLPGQGPLHWCVDRGPLRLIGLDTCVPGRHFGRLDQPALDWLAARLGQDPARPTLVLMHHPPFRCGIPYMDSYRLVDEQPLGALLARHPQVQAVLCGHLHRMMIRRWAGTVVISAPSTATEIDLQLAADASPRSWLGERGYLLHQWSGQDGLITHHVTTADRSGPYPFA